MHIGPHDNRNSPIVDVDHELVPLNYFNIVRLKKGEAFEYAVPGYETCVVPATGTVTVDVEGAIYEHLGNRGVDVWDGEPEGVYVPVGAKVRIVCMSDTTETFVAGARYDKALEPFDIRVADIDVDEENKTLTIADSGIGMARDELIENLGTIAYSGAKAFLKALEEDKQASVEQIGQFGVGFYSAFMVAQEITVISRSFNQDAQVYAWTSTGSNDYTVKPAEREHRGTSVILKLKDDADEFLKAYRLESIVKRYSDFVPFPIYVGESVANQKTALWRQRPQEITDEQYEEFYRHVT